MLIRLLCFFFLKVGFECRMFPRIKYFILSLEEKDLSFPLLAFLSLSGSYLARCSDLVIHLLQCTFFFFFFLSLEYRLAASALARPRVTSSHFLNLLLRNVSQAFFFTLGCRCDLLTRHLLPWLEAAESQPAVFSLHHHLHPPHPQPTLMPHLSPLHCK